MVAKACYFNYLSYYCRHSYLYFIYALLFLSIFGRFEFLQEYFAYAITLDNPRSFTLSSLLIQHFVGQIACFFRSVQFSPLNLFRFCLNSIFLIIAFFAVPSLPACRGGGGGRFWACHIWIKWMEAWSGRRDVKQERSNKAGGAGIPFWRCLAALCRQQKMSAQLIGLVCQ